MPVESGQTNLNHIPHMSLPDLHGNSIDLLSYSAGSISVIFFSCNHCPYVQWIEKSVAQLVIRNEDVRWMAICSNDVQAYPDDDVPGLMEQCARAAWNFPYLVDQSQKCAHAFGAVCTPDFFVFDAEGALVYRGALDESRPKGAIAPNGHYLQAAIDAARSHRIFSGGRPSMGCGIKWREN